MTNNDTQNNRGSEWRKWDLHIHTPKSIIQTYGGDTPEIWEKFILSLENLPSDTKVIGINDYYFIDRYKKVMSFKKNGSGKSSVCNILKNVSQNKPFSTLHKPDEICLSFDDGDTSSFPPIFSSKATILILGSAPGTESLRVKQYYGHKRNSFWKIMGEIFEFNYEISYEKRENLLIANNVAVWDVIKSCKRKGSLDSKIKQKSIEINDFSNFFNQDNKIRMVFFNGALPEKEYIKRVIPNLPKELKNIPYMKLPSISPALATLKYEDKLEKWKVIKDKKPSYLLLENVKSDFRARLSL